MKPTSNASSTIRTVRSTDPVFSQEALTGLFLCPLTIHLLWPFPVHLFWPLTLCENSLNVYRQLASQDEGIKQAIERIANSPDIIHLDTFLDDIAHGHYTLDVGRDVLKIVDEVPHDDLSGSHLGFMANLLTTSRLDKEALKYFPLNAVDDTFGNFYKGLEDFLPNSSYINNHGQLTGASSNIAADVGNVLGEYRERRYLKHIYEDKGHTRIYDHFDSQGQNVTDHLTQGSLEVNNPSRLDAITQNGDTYFIGEAKDGGLRFGKILDGASGGSKVAFKPTDFALIRLNKGNFELDVAVFTEQLEKLVDAGNITILQQQAIEDAVRNGKLELDIFIGGEHINALGNSSLRSIAIHGIANPFNPDKRIKINLIPD